MLYGSECFGRMRPFRERLNISTIAEDAAELAGEYGLGLEIAEFCTAYNMDLNFPETDARARSAMEKAPGRVFHAPFAELCPAAIDPLVREVTRKRYLQAISLARSYGIRKIVIHAGFIPQVYWPEWFVPQSVEFWKNLLPEIGPDMLLCLENVMEPDADMLVSIVEETGDPRLRLCLDTGHAASRPDPVPIEEWIDKAAPYVSPAGAAPDIGNFVVSLESVSHQVSAVPGKESRRIVAVPCWSVSIKDDRRKTVFTAPEHPHERLCLRSPVRFLQHLHPGLVSHGKTAFQQFAVEVPVKRLEILL